MPFDYFNVTHISKHKPKTKTISYNILNTIPYPNTPTTPTIVTIIIAKHITFPLQKPSKPSTVTYDS